MAKNDFSVLVYKLLSILDKALKTGRNVSLQDLVSNQVDFPIGEDYWKAILEDLLNKGFITGIVKTSVVGGSGYKDLGIRITLDGEQYLHDNSQMQKVRDLLGPMAEAVAAFIVK